jgi:glycosyl hydrolase family 28
MKLLIKKTIEVTERSILSRRECLRRLALPGAAMALGPILSATRVEAQTAATSVPRGDDAGSRVYNVRAYGAKGDGVSLDTAALQASIDVCHMEGGGTVFVPKGTFVIGTVELKSNVTLHIVASGKLLGSGKGKDYHAAGSIPLKGDSTLNDGNWALIYAFNAKNITIEGMGTIDGQGAQFVAPGPNQLSPSGLEDDQRPYHVLFYGCERVLIKDVALINGAYHSVRIIHSQLVQIDRVYIHNRVNGNNDGFHFISCKHVAVSNCTVYALDDACAMFGSCECFTVNNCLFSTRWSVFRFGGGVARNIAISNCILKQVYGCPIKFQGNEGALFEDISFSNLILDDVTGPIHISVGSGEHGKAVNPGLTPELAESSRKPPAARRISFSHIHGTVTTSPGRLEGLPDGGGYREGERFNCITLNAVGNGTIEDISFDDVQLTFGGGGTAAMAARRDLPQVASEYFMLGPMPAYGLYARNARGVTVMNLRLKVDTQDLRPAIVFDHVEDAALNAINAQGNVLGESLLRLIDSKQVLITALRAITECSTCLQIEGVESHGIVVDGGDLSRAAEVTSFSNGAMKSSVSLRSATQPGSL